MGTYNVTAESPGFQKMATTGIIVEINQTVRTNFTLAVGALTQTVAVEATIAAIKTDDATVSEVMNSAQHRRTAVERPRPYDAGAHDPGVLQGTKSSATGIPPGEDFNGAGTREIQNSMSLDGISIMNNLITTTPTRPMVEAVQEVEVQTGTYSAQYGAYMGVHINMVTKCRHEPDSRGTGGVPPQPGAGCAGLLHAAYSGQPDRGQAAAAAEPVRLRGRRAGLHPETL